MTVERNAEIVSRLNDSKADFGDNAARWLSAPGLPVRVTFAWDAPQTVGALRILSGFRDGATQTTTR